MKNRSTEGTEPARSGLWAVVLTCLAGAVVGLVAGGIVLLRSDADQGLPLGWSPPVPESQGERGVVGFWALFLAGPAWALYLLRLVQSSRVAMAAAVAIAAVGVGVVVDAWVIDERAHPISDQFTYEEAREYYEDLVVDLVRDAAGSDVSIVVEEDTGDESVDNRCRTSQGADTGSARLFLSVAFETSNAVRRSISLAGLESSGVLPRSDAVDVFVDTVGWVDSRAGSTVIHIETPCLRDL